MKQSKYQHILDNRSRTVADYLRQHLPETDVFRLVSAYFTLYGYEALAEELDNIDDVRFLFGDPSSVGTLDPGEQPDKAFRLTEQGLSPQETLKQKPLALRCKKWVECEDVQIRSARTINFLHGKLYHTESSDKNSAIVGSSNFTRRGLGCSQDGGNLEINLATEDNKTTDELRNWFDALWNNENLTEDVKNKVIEALDRIGENYAPQQVYYKTLFELFREELERRQRGDQSIEDIHLYDTAVWQSLYNFQREGVKSVINRLLRYNGCILADSVGLGKTWTALAVIKFFELRNERVLVLCPRKLRDNWELYPIYNAQQHNPFIKDRFSYTLLSHTDLSRNTGMAGTINLANFNWSSFDLIVIDESHHFRNESKPRYDDDDNIIRHSRYSRLLNEVIGTGTKTKVLMLSATPVNTSLIDLRNQLYLMTERKEDVFRETLGINSIGSLLNRSQKAFKQWEEATPPSQGRNKAELLERLDADFFRLLGGVSIARSRHQIEKFYADDMKSIGSFPKKEVPENVYPDTDLHGQLSYDALVKKIDQFSLSIYRPSDYVTDPDVRQRLEEEKARQHFNQQTRENYLIAMIKVNFMKRLESSAYSLTETLRRTVDKIEKLLEKIERYENTQNEAENIDEDTLPDSDQDDDDFLINRARNPYHLRELDLDRWKRDLAQDKQALTSAFNDVKAITPERDGKLVGLLQDVRSKAKRSNRKLLVFTTFKDTAEYIYDNLKLLAEELNLSMAMVAGDTTQTNNNSANNFNHILTNFSPVSRERSDTKDSKGDEDIDLLIATDCISEGQNLQDCDTVLNYDIHWNPVRLVQRFGRIDRIGSKNESIKMINYWPTKDMEAYLRLESRVLARMALADATATGDGDPLTTEQAQTELSFRDRQLLNFRKEIVDLDEVTDGVVLSDFTLDYFLSQLLAYLEENRKELERMPPGAYAVTSYADTGVIFVLRRKKYSGDRREKNASPLHPYYIVFVRDNGDIRYTVSNATKTLRLFEDAAIKQDKPIASLCDWFDHKTQLGEDMSHYDQLLSTVIQHIKRADQKRQTGALQSDRDALLPVQSSNNDSEKFELVTWLVLASET